MKHLIFTSIFLAIANIAIFIRTAEVTSFSPIKSYSYFSDCESYAKEIYCETNYARAENSKQLLYYSDELEEVSKKKSEDMCALGYFSHDYDGRSWTYFIDNSGIQYIKAGENLSKGYKTAPEAIQALLNSPSHYENIMGDYTHIGVYTASCGGKNYTTQTFAKL